MQCFLLLLVQTISVCLALVLLVVPAVNPWSFSFSSTLTRRQSWNIATETFATSYWMVLLAREQQKEEDAISLLSTTEKSDTNGVTSSTSASTRPPLSEEEEEQAAAAAVQQRLLERRQLMQASRSSNSRQSYLDLSRQRAALYNTTSQAVSCPPNIPCL
jgi:hypothetical protein